MKKIFTLFAGLLMAAAVFAADRRPTVTLDNHRHFKVVIDGRAYYGDNVRIIMHQFNGYSYGKYRNGRHVVKVYEMSRGRFQRERLVDATTFVMGRNDLKIKIDVFGQIRIMEKRNGWNNGRGNRYDDRDFGKHGRGGVNISIDADMGWLDIARDDRSIDTQDQPGRDDRDGRPNRF